MPNNFPNTFIYNGYSTEHIKNGVISFSFTLLHKDKTHTFTETVHFDPQGVVFETLNPQLLRNTLDALMLFLGISYWKLSAPNEIKITNNFLNKKQAEFWNLVFTKGMGELYKNNIDFQSYELSRY